MLCVYVCVDVYVGMCMDVYADENVYMEVDVDVYMCMDTQTDAVGWSFGFFSFFLSVLCGITWT